MKVADVPSSTKLVLTSKVESIISTSNKGKEVVQEPMKILNIERSNSIETDEELPI